MTSAHDFVLSRLNGQELRLADFAGRPILIANTASKCGFTPQYAGLQTLWSENEARGLVVIGVPSNDFGNQEPGGASEIAEFCQINYGVGFPMAAKVHVKGPEADPLFRWLGDQGGFLARPRWNFFKYLIGPDGQLKTWFSSLTPPTSPRVRRAVEALLP